MVKLTLFFSVWGVDETADLEGYIFFLEARTWAQHGALEKFQSGRGIQLKMLHNWSQ